MPDEHSEVNASIEQIRRLNLLDRKIIALRQRREEDPETLRQLQQRLQEAREATAKVEKELLAARKQADEQDLQLKSTEAEILRLRTQLATAKNLDNKQYRTFLHEIEGKEADKSILEDKILGLFGRIDELNGELKRRRQEVAQREAELQNETQRIEAELKEIERQLGELEKPRAELVAQIHPDLLARYERVLRQRGLTAVVEVRNQTCQGCFTRLTLQNYAQLASGKEVTFCRTCQRILVMPDEEMANFESTASRQAATGEQEDLGL